MGNVTKDYPEPDPLPEDDIDAELDKEIIESSGPTDGSQQPTSPLKESGKETTGDEKEPKEAQKGSEEGLKKALTDTKRAYTKSQMELAELKGRLSAMETKPPSEPQKDWMEDFGDDALRLNPELVKEMIRKHREEVVGVLRQRDQYWEGQLKNLDPDVLSMKDRIAELRQDPDYQQFTDKQLAIIARKTATAEPEEETVIVRSPGSPAGGRGSASGAGKETNIRQSSLYKKIYGEG